MSFRARVVTDSFFPQSTTNRLSLPQLPASAYATAAGSKLRCRAMTPGSVIRIAVVGDVHDLWDLEKDTRALQFLQADVVLFTGDFGNENVDIVKSISSIELRKAAILGNHDAWYTSEMSYRKTDRVQLQLQCLKEQHVGYSRLDFPSLKLSVVGGRPFSCGGEWIFRQGYVSARYGIKDMVDSAKKIYEAALGTPEGHTVIVLAHNGPTGLGSKVNDICGKDWLREGGDNGDPDLAEALDNLKRGTRIHIPLVVFGHMHKGLQYGMDQRKMIAVRDDTIYLNGAIVPRVRRFKEQQGSSSSSSGGDFSIVQHQTPDNKDCSIHVFTIIETQSGKIEKISENWVAVMESNCEMAAENVLFESKHLHATWRRRCCFTA